MDVPVTPALPIAGLRTGLADPTRLIDPGVYPVLFADGAVADQPSSELSGWLVWRLTESNRAAGIASSSPALRRRVPSADHDAA